MLDEKAARRLLETAADDLGSQPSPVDSLLARGRSARRRRRVLAVVGAASAAVALWGGTVAVGGLDGINLRTQDGAVSGAPSLDADATPQQVIGAYVAVLNKRDRVGAMSLLTPEHGDQRRRVVGGLFVDTPMTDLRLGTPDAAYPRSAESSRADGWEQAVFVPATLRMDGRHTPWGYLLVRHNDTERWQIAAEGPV